MRNAVILGATRTPIGKFGGGLSNVSAVKLGGIVIAEALKRAELAVENVDEVIMGNVIFAGQGMNPARQASIAGGLPTTVPAMTINKVCGSGLKAVALAAQAIRSGDADVIICGGFENMSLAPYLLRKARYGYRLGEGELIDSVINDGLSDCMIDCHMGVTAEHLAKIYGLSRQDIDHYALRSQKRANKAIKEGLFDEEIVNVYVEQRKGDVAVISSDEHPRLDTSIEGLAQLSPAFAKDGLVTAGNSSGINDGASAMVVMDETKARELSLEPMALIRSYASAALEPMMMGVAPVQAIRGALDKAEKTLEDIDLIEINEAFAAQVLSVGAELDLDWGITNVNGGAIALGHPIGASGARILTTLLYEMKRRDDRFGLASLCIGGGQGIAMVVERV
ncbi:acetyl-CoA C-acetyltransferase [SAR202 cluster bacterium AC-409-J13_OGT_754m]|nr:acetyl-CoA C-acetyltransferase [SAR202 cluster bacterium AC-409-J13_OGT_754m]